MLPEDVQTRKAIQGLIASYNIIDNIESIKSDWEDTKKKNLLTQNPISLFMNGGRILYATARKQLLLFSGDYSVDNILDAIKKDELGRDRCEVNNREAYIEANVKNSNCCFMPFKRACLSCEEATPNIGWDIDSKVNKILNTLQEKTENANETVKQVRCMNAIKQIYEIYPDIYNEQTREKALSTLRKALDDVLSAQRNNVNNNQQPINNNWSRTGIRRNHIRGNTIFFYRDN